MRGCWGWADLNPQQSPPYSSLSNVELSLQLARCFTDEANFPFPADQQDAVQKTPKRLFKRRRLKMDEKKEKTMKWEVRESTTQAREIERKFKKQKKEKWQINKSNHKKKPQKKTWKLNRLSFVNRLHTVQHSKTQISVYCGNLML